MNKDYQNLVLLGIFFNLFEQKDLWREASALPKAAGHSSSSRV
jgi:hypothetical protein